MPAHCLGCADSPDGVTWTPHPANPLAVPADIPWGRNWQTPHVLLDEREQLYQLVREEVRAEIAAELREAHEAEQEERDALLNTAAKRLEEKVDDYLDSVGRNAVELSIATGFHGGEKPVYLGDEICKDAFGG